MKMITITRSEREVASLEYLRLSSKARAVSNSSEFQKKLSESIFMIVSPWYGVKEILTL
jgi:hypothetical protein